jgi:phospholipase/carboxylesterase
MDDLAMLSGPSLPPASGAAAQSLVVFLHGYGSNGADLIALGDYWKTALPHTAFVSPNAPEPCPGAPGGYQWWPLANLSPAARAAGVRTHAAALNRFLDAQLAAHGLGPDKLALVGFSQGTMMALHLGPRRNPALAGIVGYSGMLADPDALAAEALSRPPLLLIHGDADPVVPVSALQAAASVFEALGFPVATHVSRGLEHSIDPAGLRLGAEFLARVLG